MWAEKIQRFFQHLETVEEISFDVETDGLDWHTNKILSYQFAFSSKPEDVYYFPLAYASGNMPADLAEQFTYQLVEAAKTVPGAWIGHNLMFDLLATAKHDLVPKGKWICTMTTQAIIDEHQRSYALSACAQAMGVTPKQDKELNQYLVDFFKIELNPAEQADFDKGLYCKKVKELKGRLAELPADAPMVQGYGEGDVITTWELFQKQKKMLAIKENGTDLLTVADIEWRCTKALYWMQRRGIKINEAKLEQVVEDTRNTYQAALANLPKIPKAWLNEVLKYKASIHALSAQPKDFPLGQDDIVFSHRSRDHMLAIWLYQGYPLADIPKTDKGGFSFTSKFLDSHPFGKQFAGLRKTDKLLSAFLAPLKERHTINGRVFGSYHQLRADEGGTITGRLSSSNPNLQQVPKRDEGNSKLIRQLFEADPGYIWSSNDLSQAEYRIFSHYTQNKKLIEGYKADPPVDMHTTVSKDVIKLAEMLDRDKARFAAKTLNFALLYGAQSKKVAMMLGIDEHEAADLINDYYRNIEGVEWLMRTATQRARTHGYVRTLTGRRCRFAKGDYGYYKAANKIIQGTNADFTKLKLAEIQDLFEANDNKAQLLLTVHDAIDWQFEDSAAGHALNEEALRIFAAETPGIFELRVPMKVDHKTGRTWAEAS